MDDIQLKFSPKYRAYFLIMPTGKTAGIAKEAGFGFHKKVRHWFTYDPGKAVKLKQYADEKTIARLRAIGQTIKLSRATGHEDFCKDIQLKPPPKDCQYKPYQKAGIAFIRDRAVTLLADEQGLGKTIQAIGAWNEWCPSRTLIICPASVKYIWLREFAIWGIGEPKCHVQQGRKGYPLNPPPVVIVNYDVVNDLHEELTDKPWDAVVLDESHYLKNPKAKRTQAVLGYKTRQGIVKGANHVVLLTGTPVPNRPIEFWPMLTRLAPDVIAPFTKYFDFGRRFCNAYQGPYGWDMTGSSNEKELNHRLRASIMIRRLKADVLKDLPDKIFQVVPFEADPVAKRLIKAESKLVDFDQLKKTAKPKGLEIGELSELRHKLAKLKTPLCISHIKDLLDSGTNKVVVFAHHSAVIDMLMAGLKDYLPVKLDGKITAVQKQRAVDTFQQNPDCRVFVGQIQAAGVGITLTAASNVIFVETSWVPGEIAQAVDRCHRIGQKNSVLAQFLVIRGSLEEYMLRTVLDKQHTINRVIN
jgi:SWI/SNF-related matrix-associated actin-dependent regulator 1 of chromatin subfamily A